jgi:MFS family permease
MVREAVRYALAKRTIRWPWALAAVVAVFSLSLPVLLAGYADHVFKIGAGGYGLLNALVAVGSLAGAVASARRRLLRLETVVVAAGLYGALLALAAFVPSLPAFAVLMAVSGFCALTFMTSANQLVQTSANMAIRGRVMSLYTMVLIGGQALGGPMLGGLAQALGTPWAMFLGGLVPAVVCGLLVLRLRTRREG